MGGGVISTHVVAAGPPRLATHLAPVPHGHMAIPRAATPRFIPNDTFANLFFFKDKLKLRPPQF